MENRGMGALKSPKDLRDYRITKAAAAIELPEEFVLAHSHIKNQGAVGSCVAHSVSEVLETKDNINYSTGWIYGYRRSSNPYLGSGMATVDALKTVNKVGYLKNSELDVNVEMIEAKNIVDKDIEKYTELASKRKISSYARLMSIEEVKQALYLYKVPVILCIDTDKNGLKLDKKYIAQVPTQPYGGHAIVCYGWNKDGFLIQNSWGEKWGNYGCFILPYEYSFYEAWMISFDTSEDRDVEEDNEEPKIVKPNFYIFREIIMTIVKIIRKMLKK